MSNDFNFFTMVERVFESWHYDHPRILYALIRSLKPEVVVEIGTYRGYGACYMAQALKENGKGHLYCIDDFSGGTWDGKGREHLETNLKQCQVRDYITIIEGKASEVKWPNKVDFAYIDGWHSYNCAKQEFGRCEFFGAECICVDDTTSTVGPSLFVQRMRGHPDWDFCEIQRDAGLAIFTKRKNKPPVRCCQESTDNSNSSSVDISTYTTEQKRELLKKFSAESGVDYSDYIFE